MIKLIKNVFQLLFLIGLIFGALYLLDRFLGLNTTVILVALFFIKSSLAKMLVQLNQNQQNTVNGLRADLETLRREIKNLKK